MIAHIKGWKMLVHWKLICQKFLFQGIPGLEGCLLQHGIWQRQKSFLMARSAFLRPPFWNGLSWVEEHSWKRLFRPVCNHIVQTFSCEIQLYSLWQKFFVCFILLLGGWLRLKLSVFRLKKRTEQTLDFVYHSIEAQKRACTLEWFHF